MNIYNKEKLDEHYNINIFQKNKEQFISGGIGDKSLNNAKNDNRMSLDLLIRIPSEISDKIEECISELKNIEPNVYYYPKTDFHITVIDILIKANCKINKITDFPSLIYKVFLI